MAISADDLFAETMTDEMIEASNHRFKELMEEFDNLKALRKSLGLTQENIGEKVGKKQVSIAQLEKRSDLLLSTLRQYVEALGGELELVVTFKNKKAARLSGIRAHTDEKPATHKERRSRRPTKAA